MSDLGAQSTLELVEAPRHPLYRLARPLERRHSAGENGVAHLHTVRVRARARFRVC